MWKRKEYKYQQYLISEVGNFQQQANLLVSVNFQIEKKLEGSTQCFHITDLILETYSNILKAFLNLRYQNNLNNLETRLNK